MELHLCEGLALYEEILEGRHSVQRVQSTSEIYPHCGNVSRKQMCLYEYFQDVTHLST